MTKLAARFEVRRRFQRSVHLAADATRDDACEGYALTAVGRATLTRMLAGVAPGGRARAWSLTGPYGSGKSAFAVLLAQLLHRPVADARRLVADEADVAAALDRVRIDGRSYTLLLVTATFGPLIPAIVSAVEESLHGRRGARVEQVLEEARALRTTRTRGAAVHRRVVALVGELASLSAQGRGGGLLIAIDEFGKTLEHAARGDDRADDVFLLQELAELAARSAGAPVLLVTLLHQSFDRYARGLGASTRAEWAKVQGRFEDVAFLDAPGEILRLAARSIRRRGVATDAVFTRYDDVAREAVALALAPPSQEAVLRDLAPLHPTVSLLLPSLFRGPLAQNERSLFDFLSSRAPGAFGAFLDTTDDHDGPTYTLDRLYDFLAATLAPAQLAGPDARRWAAVEGALAGLGDDATTAALVKAIGILNILGNRTLRASRETLRFALEGDASRVLGALDALQASSQVVYRRHNDSFALWEGSDVDLDARFDDARRKAVAVEALSELLRERQVLRPRVARRHFIETGTLRYFDVALASTEGVRLAIAPTEEADGRVVYLLPSGEASARDLVELALQTTLAPEVVVGVPRASDVLVAAVRDWCAWEAVRVGDALDHDPVARRELAVRIRASAAALDAAVASCFDPCGDVVVTWVRGGTRQPWNGPRGVTGGLSAVCDAVYVDAPRLKNELLNRRALSSAAAAARRALLDAMITAGAKPGLGIEGAPPEWSMYASLLAEGGLHRVRGDAWGFGPPPPDDPLRLLPTWRAIEGFLDTTDGTARPLRELFRALARPPIGLREGPAPVLFLAVVLASPGEVALFEDGTFVPDLSGAVIERLLRRVDHFTVARYRVTGARAAALDALRALVGAESPQPVAVARALIRRLNGYARYTRTTRRAGALGLAARDALTTARDPMRLLFYELPQALDVAPFHADTDDPTQAEVFAQRLSVALDELDNAYPSLLAAIESSLGRALELDGAGETLRAAMARRARSGLRVAVDLRLRAFLGRAAVVDAPQREWLEGVAMVVGNRPPTEWSDAEFARFELGLAELRALLGRAESLAAGAPTRLAPEEVPLVDDAAQEILRALEARLGGRREVWLAALGRTMRRVMDDATGDDARPEGETS